MKYETPVQSSCRIVKLEIEIEIGSSLLTNDQGVGETKMKMIMHCTKYSYEITDPVVGRKESKSMSFFKRKSGMI